LHLIFFSILTLFKLRPAIVGDSLVDVVDARVGEYIANMLGTTPCIKVDQFVPRLLLSHLPRSQSGNFPRCRESYGCNLGTNRYLPILTSQEMILLLLDEDITRENPQNEATSYLMWRSISFARWNSSRGIWHDMSFLEMRLFFSND